MRLARVAGAADVYVDLQIWPEMIHVWHLFHPELSAGKKAIAAGGAFVRAHIAHSIAGARHPALPSRRAAEPAVRRGRER